MKTVERWSAALVVPIEPNIIATCRDRVWPVPPAPVAGRPPVKSQIPTLLVYGEVDSTSSRYDAEQGAIGLPNSRILTIRGTRPYSSDLAVSTNDAASVSTPPSSEPAAPTSIDPSCLAPIPPV